MRKLPIHIICFLCLFSTMTFSKNDTSRMKEHPNYDTIYMHPNQNILDGIFNKMKASKLFNKELNFRKYNTPSISIPLSLFHKYFITSLSSYKKEIHFPKLQADNFRCTNLADLDIKLCVFKDELIIRNIRLREFPMGLINLYGDSIPSLQLKNINGSISLTNSFLKHNLTVDSIKSSMYFYYLTIPIDNAGCYFNTSTLSLNVTNSEFKDGVYAFNQDTINNINFTNNKGDVKFLFRNSTFSNNSSFSSSKLDSSKSISFENCSFNDSHYNLTNVDSLKFINCENIKNQLLLDIKTDSLKTFYLYVENSDLTHVTFNYTSQFRLLFKKGTTDDQIEQVYQLLRDKFKTEGKSISYENIDIQYKQYKYSNLGFIGNFWSWIDGIWWNYGYSRLRIIGWTLGLLFLFFIINLIVADNLIEFYPVFIVPTTRAFPKFHLVNKIVVIFILTCQIFFTLKIDLSTVKISRTGMMIYFFTQYALGLICLFFLINAIFKI